MIVGIVATIPIIRNIARIIGYYISRWVYPTHQIEIRRIHNGKPVGQPVIVELSAKEPIVRQLRIAKRTHDG